MDGTSSSSPIPSGRRAERNRHAIVAAAHEVFLRDGYSAGMDTVASAARVSKVTVYNHFKSKEELFTAVIGQALDEALGSTLDEARACLVDTADTRQALTRTARALVKGITRPSVLALRNLVTGELRRFPELGRAWNERGPGRISRVVGEVFGDLTERGRLAIPDVEVAAIQFFALTLYPHLTANAFGVTLSKDLSERLITGGVEMFLGYYQPRLEADREVTRA